MIDEIYYYFLYKFEKFLIEYKNSSRSKHSFNMTVTRHAGARFSFEFTFKGHLLRRDRFSSWDDAENAEISARQMLGVWTTSKRKSMMEARKKCSSLPARSAPFPPPENDPISERWNSEIVDVMLKNIPFPSLRESPAPATASIQTQTDAPAPASIQTQTDAPASEENNDHVVYFRELLDIERAGTSRLMEFLDATWSSRQRLMDIIEELNDRS